MAKLKVVVTFYSIDKCGHYPWSGTKGALGGIESTMSDLKHWADGKPITLTKLADVKDADETLPVYLIGIDKTGDDWTIATWNEVPAGQGGVASVAMDSVVGNEPEVYANEVVADSIPGFATYFWIVPERNVLATLRMEKTVAGKEAMRSYVETFLFRESPFAVENKDGEIVGYREPESVDKEVYKFHPRFRISQYSKKGALDEIRNNVDKIVKVVKVGRLTASDKVDRTFYQGVLSFLRGANPERRIVSEKKIRMELEMTPTKAELDQMIKEELSSEHTAHWEDLGFAFKGETNRISWVSKSLARESFEMDLEVNEGGVVLIDSLKKELADRREQLLRLLH